MWIRLYKSEKMFVKPLNPLQSIYNNSQIGWHKHFLYFWRVVFHHIQILKGRRSMFVDVWSWFIKEMPWSFGRRFSRKLFTYWCNQNYKKVLLAKIDLYFFYWVVGRSLVIDYTQGFSWVVAFYCVDNCWIIGSRKNFARELSPHFATDRAQPKHFLACDTNYNYKL